MTTAIARQDQHPTDPATGLTLPLSRSLASQDLAKHAAMVALELEVMAKKMDRFGWERDRGTAAHDRIVMDWMNALQDYPLSEVQGACRKWVASNPRKVPNEGDILGIIRQERRSWLEASRVPQPEPERPPRVTSEEAAEILKRAGVRVNEHGGVVSLGGEK